MAAHGSASSSFRPFSARATVAILAVLAALVAYDAALVPWALAQLVRALWPLPSPLFARLEEWAWEHWEAEAGRGVLEPRAVEEIAIGMAPRSRARPFVVRGLLNGTGSPLVGNDFSWLTKPPVGELEVDYFANASVVDGVVP